MTKKKILILFLSVILILSCFLSLTYAAKVISVYGQFETKGVDVSISAEQSNDLIAPGMRVKYEPVISYQGVDAYIRFTLDISEDDLTLYHFTGLSDDWVRRGRYFYYRKPVHHKEEIETFKSFHIPETWDETMPQDFMGSTFTITASCDAVQAKNFSPDFERENPWGSLEIEDNAYDGDTYVETISSKKELVGLTFNGFSKYTLNSDILVEENILPGDTYENEIVLTNKGGKDTEVFFSVSEMKAFTDKNNLLDAVELTLRLDDKEFYHGTLRAAELVNWKSLVYMKPDSTHRLSYKIHMPKELQNAYEEKLDKFQWNFQAKEIPNAPKTGDRNYFLFFTGIAGICFFLLFMLTKKGKRDESKN